MSDDALHAVRTFWEKSSCGEDLYLAGTQLDDYDYQARERYRIEPYIRGFAQFEQYRDRRVLEIGVGAGADHEQFAIAGAILSGVDLTDRAIHHAERRLALRGLSSDLRRCSAEQLTFADNSFDLVYSWGVLHHIPSDTRQVVAEILRVLKPGGEAKVMVYHKYSFVGYMLWFRYGLARGRPHTPLTDIYSRYLESPNTRAFSVEEAQGLFSRFEIEAIKTTLTHADLLTSAVGQRHRGRALDIMRRVWPRRLIQRFFPSHGLFLMVAARKPLPISDRSDLTNTC